MPDYIADARRAKHFSRFNISKALLELSHGPPQPLDIGKDGYNTRGALTGLEAEINSELQRDRKSESPNSCWIPWEAFGRATRAETVGAGSAGGYLVATDHQPPIPALYANSVTIALGAQVEPGQVGNYVRPTQSGTATAYWLGTETSQINGGASSQQTFSQAAGTPKGVGAYTEISRQLLLQGAAIEAAVDYDLLKLVGTAVDLAAMTGAGTAGVPLGLLNMGGIGTFSGTSFSLATAMIAVTDIGNALDSSAGWAANRAAAITLRQRQEFTNSTRSLWEDSVLVGEITGFPARSTLSLASGVMIFGAWRHLRIPVWGAGVEVEINPYAGFQAGIVGVRALCYCDIVCDYQSAFAATSTFT